MKQALLALCTAQTLLIAGNETPVEHYQADYSMTYEQIELPGTEKMGLVGLGMLFDVSGYGYGGVRLYGAVDGERGGFFTVGAEGGLKVDLSEHLRLKSGLFVGAGGGGAAPQGGGLMLRPYAQLAYHTPTWSLGLGVSHVAFPNGDIQSTQAYLSLELPTEGSYLKGQHFGEKSPLRSTALQTESEAVTVSFFTEHYTPDAGSLNTDGVTPTKPYSLAGIKFDKALGEHLYSYFQAAGAGGGESDGYMEIFGGLGARYQLADLPFTLGAEVAIGASGGGKVDTGGGLVYRAQGTVQTELGKHLTLSGFGGVIKAVDGTFSATTYGVTLGYKTTLFDTLTQEDAAHANPSNWRLRMLNKSYLDGEKLFKTPKGIDRVDLLGFAIDWYLTENFYITGQSYWAYKGKAGGYAEGIFGLGYQSDHYHGFSFFGEMLGGVGGGGGVNIGGGLFGSVGAGITYAINDSWEVGLEADYLRNSSGSFTTTALKAHIGYRFSLLEAE